MQEIDWFAEISKYIGIVVAAGGGGAAVVFGVFQAWGKGWLDSHFNKRLEEFKHEQTKEIERIKADINTTFDRAQRLHQLEFDALPTLWEKLVEAHNECSKFVQLLRQYVDVGRMNNEKFTAFLEEEGCSKYEIEALVNEPNRQKSFIRFAEQRNFNRASRSYNDFRVYFKKKSVFLSKEIKDRIEVVSTLVRDALYEQYDNLLEDDIRIQKDKMTAFREQSQIALDGIESLVRIRLGSASAEAA